MLAFFLILSTFILAEDSSAAAENPKGSAMWPFNKKSELAEDQGCKNSRLMSVGGNKLFGGSETKESKFLGMGKANDGKGSAILGASDNDKPK